MEFFSRLFDFFLPHTCAICGRRTGRRAEGLCPVCYMKLPRTGFHEDPYENPMARKYGKTVPVEKVAAWVYYTPDTVFSRPVIDFKYHFNPRLAYHLGYCMAKETEGFLRDIDVIIPVPITRRRRRQRGYNQSQLLAWGVSMASGIPVVDDVLKRNVFNRSQTSLRQEERQENVRNAFAAKNTRKIENLHCLIMDDVVTTGATTIECVNALKHVSGAKFSILAFAFTKEG